MNVAREINRILRRMGVEVRQYGVQFSEEARVGRMLLSRDVEVVLDVGANEGQYGKSLRDVGYRGMIVSFEPLLTAYQELLRASVKDPLWHVAPRMAVGEEEGSVEINISKNSVSSSVLPMKERHLRAAPESIYVGKECVRVARLDDVAMPYVKGKRAYLKIDTQGFEAQVLAGAEQILREVGGLQIELSLVEVYQGQRLFDEMLKQLVGMGFELYGLTPVLSDPETGQMLQVDGVFVRNSKAR